MPFGPGIPYDYVIPIMCPSHNEHAESGVIKYVHTVVFHPSCYGFTGIAPGCETITSRRISIYHYIKRVSGTVIGQGHVLWARVIRATYLTQIKQKTSTVSEFDFFYGGWSNSSGDHSKRFRRSSLAHVFVAECSAHSTVLPCHSADCMIRDGFACGFWHCHTANA